MRRSKDPTKEARGKSRKIRNNCGMCSAGALTTVSIKTAQQSFLHTKKTLSNNKKRRKQMELIFSDIETMQENGWPGR